MLVYQRVSEIKTMVRTTLWHWQLRWEGCGCQGFKLAEWTNIRGNWSFAKGETIRPPPSIEASWIHPCQLISKPWIMVYWNNLIRGSTPKQWYDLYTYIYNVYIYYVLKPRYSCNDQQPNGFTQGQGFCLRQMRLRPRRRTPRTKRSMTICWTWIFGVWRSKAESIWKPWRRQKVAKGEQKSDK